MITSYKQDTYTKQELSKDTKSGIAGIDPHKITGIKIDNVTEMEMQSLATAEPEKYKDAKAAEFRSLKVTYLSEDNKEVEKTFYERYKQ